MHTTLKLHREGWQTVFHNTVVARGVAPEDYDSYTLQRLRWAQGSMQFIRREWRGRELTCIQKLNYLGSTGTYFDSYRKLIRLLLIPAILISDAFPVVADARVFFGAWLAQFVVLRSANVILGRGHYRYLRTEMFDLLKMFAFIEASLILIVNRKFESKVTLKGKAGTRHLHPLLFPFVALMAVYVGVVALRAARLAGFVISSGNPAATLAAMIWAILVILTLIIVTRCGYTHITKRRSFRLPVDLEARVYVRSEAYTAQVTGLTMPRGAGRV